MTTTPLANGTLNTRSRSQVTVSFKPTQLYFRPGTGEFIIVPLEDAASFEQHGIGMIKAMDDLHEANLAISDAVTRYAEAQGSGDPTLVSAAKRSYDNTYKHQRKVAKTLRACLSNVDAPSNKALNGGGIVELIPLRDEPAARTSSRPSGYGRKLFYVSAKKIQQAWRKITMIDSAYGKQEEITPGTPFETASGMPSLIVRPKEGKAKIDIAQLEELTKKAKLQLNAELPWKFERKWDGTIADWAEKMNKDFVHTQQGIAGRFTNNVDLSSQAQAMRYSANGGASGTFDLAARKFGLKAESKGQFAIAESKGSLTMYGPHRLGWMLKIEDKMGKIHPLGALRAQLDIVLAGLAGVSFVAEVEFEITVENGKLVAKGIPTEGAAPSPIDPNDSPTLNARKLKASTPKADIALFAGARADLDVTGSLQWLNPHSADGKAPEFKDFVKLAPGVSGSIGIGWGKKFEVDYKHGKFMLIAEAEYCFGTGARGKLGFEVDVKLLGEFLIWLHTQLANANYMKLEFVTDQAFAAIQTIQFLAIKAGTHAADYFSKTSLELASTMEEISAGLEKSEHRNSLAEHVLTSPPLLRFSTPETKGMLLFHLTRYAGADWLDSDNYRQGDAYAIRKKAVIEVLRWVQTRREWDQVVRRVQRDGSKTPISARDEIMRFLRLGYDDMDDHLKRIEDRLHLAPSRGHKISANDSVEYSLHDSDSKYFAIAALEPLSEMKMGQLA